MKVCKQCQGPFEVSQLDKTFYNKIGVSEPRICSTCQRQQHLAWRNERVFYSRKCDSCERSIVTMFAPNSGHKVFCHDCWWGDAYDPLEYGREYDPKKPFFEQFGELYKAVPKLALFQLKNNNSEYTNYASRNTNCYIIVSATDNEDCLYDYRLFNSRDVVDSYDITKGELCYECLECKSVYNCEYCRRCQDSNNLAFCQDCTGCSDCFGCINLKNKQYYIFNDKHTKESYEKKLQELRAIPLKEKQEKFEAFRLTQPHRAVEFLNVQDSSGHKLSNCKSCSQCFMFADSEDCSHCYLGSKNKDANYCTLIDIAELVYNCMSLEHVYNVMCSTGTWYSHDVAYSAIVSDSNNIFACASLKKQEYCILNKKYSQEEYKKLRLEIIENMKKEGIYGDFFPYQISPFGYNESVAFEYFPMTKDAASKNNFNWQDRLPHTLGKETRQWKDIPDDINKIDSSICSDVLACEETGKNYKITKSELAFYKKKQLRVPRLHSDVRHVKRMAKLNPAVLYHRECMCELSDHGHPGKCFNTYETTYAPDRPEKVFCESCYQKVLI